MTGENCHLVKGMLGRWVVVSATDPTLAWSGFRWVRHFQGLPVAGVQVSNFSTAKEAADYASEFGFVIQMPLRFT